MSRHGTPPVTPRILRPAALAVVLLAAPAAPALADCAALQESARGLQQAGDVEGLKAVFEKVVVEPDCTADFRGALGRAVLRAVEKRIVEMGRDGKPLAFFEPDLKDALRYGQSWRVHAWLGDIAGERKDHTAAAGSYQEALAAIDDEIATPKAPPPEVIEQIFRKAERSRLLAASFVPGPTTRSAAPTGLAAANLRGFKPTKVALPIEFQYDSVEFTQKGQAAANELAATLRAQAPPSVTLVGHTDSRGSVDYNMALSKRRAEALGIYLRRAGYAGTIHVDGRGPTEPMMLDDPGQYSPDQIHQLNRRVELRR